MYSESDFRCRWCFLAAKWKMTREMKKQKETDTKLNSGIKLSEKMTAEQKSPKSQMDESGKFFKRSEKHKQVENTDVDNEKNEIVSKHNSGGKGLFRTISNIFSYQSEKTASTENSTPEQKSKSEVDQSGDSFRCSERPKQEEDKKAESWKTSVSNILEKFISKAAKSKFISTAEQLNNIHRRLFVKIWAEVQEDIHIPEKQMGKLDKKLSKSLCEKFQCTEDIMLLFMLINDPVLDDEIVSHFVKHLRTSAVRDSFFSHIWKFFSMRSEGDCVLEDDVIDADSVEDFRLEEHVSSFIPVEPLMERFGPGSHILEVSPVRDIDSGFLCCSVDTNIGPV